MTWTRFFVAKALRRLGVGSFLFDFAVKESVKQAATRLFLQTSRHFRDAHRYVCVYVCVCVYMCAYIYVYMYIYTYVYMYVCICIYICICAHTHTHTHTHSFYLKRGFRVVKHSKTLWEVDFLQLDLLAPEILRNGTRAPID